MNSHDMIENKFTVALAQAVLESFGFVPANIKDIAHRAVVDVERYRDGQRAVFVEQAGAVLDPSLARAAVAALDQPPASKRSRVLFEDHTPYVEEVA